MKKKKPDFAFQFSEAYNNLLLSLFSTFQHAMPSRLMSLVYPSTLLFVLCNKSTPFISNKFTRSRFYHFMYKYFKHYFYLSLFLYCMLVTNMVAKAISKKYFYKYAYVAITVFMCIVTIFYLLNEKHKATSSTL